MAGEIVRAATALAGTPGAQVVQLIGPATAAKRRIAAWQAADQMGRHSFAWAPMTCPATLPSLETLAVLWVREQSSGGRRSIVDARETAATTARARR